MPEIIKCSDHCYKYRGHMILVNDDETQYQISYEGEECDIRPDLISAVCCINDLCRRRKEGTLL